MLKWVVVLCISLIVLTAASPWLGRRGLGRLPGDITVRFRGRDWYLPFTSTVLISLALTAITRFI
mgnify:CR=1 FL=1